MITNDFRAFLLSFPAISTVTTEIMLWPLPEKFSAFPAITYQQDNEERTMTVESKQSGLVRSQVQLDVWGYGAESIKAFAVVLLDALRDYKGTFSESYIWQTEINNVVDIHETDTKLERVSISLSFWHREILPPAPT